MAKAALRPDSETKSPVHELPSGVRLGCDEIGQIVNVTGEQIIVCKVCKGTGKSEERTT
jgi:hypothetical protein